MTLPAATRLHQLGRNKESLHAIEALENSPDKLTRKTFRQLRFLKADVFHDLGKFLDAISCYEAIIAEEPSDVAYANKGLAHWELGEYPTALKCYIEAIRLNPANAIAQRGAAEMHIKLGSPKAAVPFLERALKLKPDYQEAYTCSGIAFYQIGSWAQADKMFQQALKLDPDDQLAKKGAKMIAKHFDS